MNLIKNSELYKWLKKLANNFVTRERSFKSHFSKKGWMFFRIFLVFVVIFSLVFGTTFIKNNTTKVPAYSGEYIEGLVGQPISLNPMFAQNDVDLDLASLMFSSLFNYKKGKLENDIAESFVQSPDNKHLDVVIKDNVYWHDNQKLTVDDVVFTYNLLAENPETASFWRGIEILKKDEKTVSFNLSSPNPNLIDSLTEKILPNHILGSLQLEEIKNSDFSENPIGSGPYYFKNINLGNSGEISSIELRVNSKWHSQKPFLRKIFFRFYPDRATLYGAFKKREIMGVGGLSPAQSEEIKKVFGANINALDLPSYQAVFFNLQNTVLAQKEVRQALNAAVNEKEILETVLLNYGQNTNMPWPANLQQNVAFSYNPETSKQILDKAGFVDANNDGIREKQGKNLKFVLSTNDDILNKTIAEKLKEYWKVISVEVEVRAIDDVALSFDAISSRNFDILLFGENLGHDLDLFAYFHSSQITKGLNFSSYTNKKVDQLFSDARSTTDKNIRKDKNFQAAGIISEDLPAIFLFSQNYLYVVDSRLKNTDFSGVVLPSERFSTINEWYLNEKRVLK